MMHDVGTRYLRRCYLERVTIAHSQEVAMSAQPFQVELTDLPEPQAFESLRRSNFVHQLPIDV